MMPSKSCDGQSAREYERQKRKPRLGPHRPKVAQVHRERAMPDGVRRREAAIEVHAFDERIDAQDLEAVPHRLDDRRVVTNADRQPIGAERAATTECEPPVRFR